MPSVAKSLRFRFAGLSTDTLIIVYILYNLFLGLSRDNFDEDARLALGMMMNLNKSVRQAQIEQKKQTVVLRMNKLLRWA